MGYASLFVIVVTVSGEDEYHDFCIVYLIHKAMLLGDTAAPLSGSIIRKLLWMTCTCARMYLQFFNQGLNLQECFWFILGKSYNVCFGCFLEINSINHSLDV